jgi:hypothetical protein
MFGLWFTDFFSSNQCCMCLMWSILFCFACMQSNSKPSATPRYFVAEATYKTTTCKWRQGGLQVATLVCVPQSKSFLGPKLPVIHGLLRATNRASAWPTLVGALPLSIYKFTVATYSLSTLASDRPPVHNEGLVHRGYLFSVHPCSQVAGNITSMACCYSTTWKLRTHFLWLGSKDSTISLLYNYKNKSF